MADDAIRSDGARRDSAVTRTEFISRYGTADEPNVLAASVREW
ncbi:hypothetical protein ABIB34_002989 [Rhodococcus sp. UYP5]